jgi:hypothetical protein
MLSIGVLLTYKNEIVYANKHCMNILTAHESGEASNYDSIKNSLKTIFQVNDTKE